ncbi:MAG TPA: protoporphyrinogen oxidase HemJ [Holosporales bacterium]|nr:protoporphyrinogen oxidase HemJ [Holosporales bacterium]
MPDLFFIMKIIHIVSLISWMAGLFYLPRLLVYHAENKDIPKLPSVFKTMQRKLYMFIMQPAQALTYISGLYLAYDGMFLKDGWMHAKILFVFFLSTYHFYLNYIRKCFNNDIIRYSGLRLRIINEIPTALLIIIVTLVILKPF